jgi:predicted RNA-binding Zn-ribbon protein involved in translation (DUF1610 family)
MIVQSAYQASSQRVSPRILATEDLHRPQCPHCGNVLLIAEESRFNGTGRVDHDWSCDDCGNVFGTSIRLWPR